LSRAFYDNPTLSGIVDRAVIVAKKFIEPKKPNCGGGWALIISVRLTVEGMSNES
jgi:ribosomal protein S12